MTTFWALLVALATYALIAAMASRALAARGLVLSRGVTPKPDAASLGLAAAANLAIGGAVVFEHSWLAGRPGTTLGLGLRPHELYACATAAGLTCALAAGHARWRRGSARPHVGAHDARTLSVAIIALACGAWMEEILFRAFALAWLRPHGDAFALIASAFLFTLVHVPTSRVDRWALANWLVGGLALGGIYMVTGSVWVATAAHLARNVTNVLWTEPATRSESGTHGGTRSAYYLVLGVATFLATCAIR